jgi:hypothetical protein
MRTSSEPEAIKAGLPALNHFQVADLLVWQRNINNIRVAFMPGSTSRPNPLVVHDMVLISVAAPGSVRAFDKASGMPRWNISLGYYGDASLYFSEGWLFGGTSRTLMCMDPSNGRVRWEFSPCPDTGTGEYIYSSPVCSDGRVFIGDRSGRLFCLSAETGQPLWMAQTSRARNRDVNATALAYEDLIITGTNAGIAVAYDQASGKPVWRTRIAGPCTDEILFYKGMALIPTVQTLYGIVPRTGDVLKRWTRPNHEIRSLAATDRDLCMVQSNEVALRVTGRQPLVPHKQLVVIRGDRVVSRVTYPPYTGTALRWDQRKRRVYEATSLGLGVIDPETGARLAFIDGFKPRHRGSQNNSIALPFADDDALYVLTSTGILARLRYPLDKGTCPLTSLDQLKWLRT